MATGLFNLKQVNQAISQGAWSGYIAPKWVEYLVVAGGGSGGGNQSAGSGGGGGGAGGLLTGIVTVTSGTSYTVTVGSGGTGSRNIGVTGNNSVFGSITANGGGGAGAGSNASNNTGLSGGSGGGGGGNGGTYNKGGVGIAGQGNAGGDANNVAYAAPDYPAAGGGGAGAPALNITSANIATNGGAGVASAISGTVVVYAGGGGGSTYNSGGTPGVGGAGGGGAGTNQGGINGSSGGDSTGGGGGGAWTGNGGNGGSGVVIVRYPGNVQFYTGGTVTYSNGYIVHNFTASGTLAPTTPTVVSEYQISRSLRFNSADSTYLSRTATANGSRTTATASLWVKRSSMGAEGRLIAFDSTGSGTIFWLFFNTSDQLQIYTSGTAVGLTTTQVFRDPSAWYHIVVGIDTNQNINVDRIKLYVNGSQVTSFTGTQTYYSLNAAIQFNNTSYTGFIGFNNSATLSGYMTEINWIDGQQLTPTSFGYVSPTTGVWTPAKYVGAYGTNGAYLNFSDNSNTTAATLGKDNSGNGNNWTPNNFSVTAGSGNDSLVDSPTSYGTDTGAGGTVRGNYSTFNPIGLGGGTLTNGNLDLSTSSTTPAVGTLGMTTGKWYWESTINSSSFPRLGVYDIGSANPTDLGATAYGWCLLNSPSRTYTNGSTTSYGAFSPTTGTVVMFAYDADAGKLWFGQDGTWFASGVPSTGTSPSMSSVTGKAIVPACASGSGTDTMSLNFGQRPFAYTAPSGFKALCTQNLPTPTIGATSATVANKYYDASLYTGNGSNSQVISNSGFQPDWVWIKARSNAQGSSLVDSVRGPSKILISNSTAAEATATNPITFNATGFTSTTDVSTNAYTYVAWQWRAGGTAVTNTAGSITSSVSANTTSGFSVVTYTGTGANATVGHGIGIAPSMVIIKARSFTQVWVVGHSSIGFGNYLLLNATDASASGSNVFNSTAPTSTVFSLGSGGGGNQSAATYVAYCFAPIAGYSAFGSYTGNGSTNGPFVFTGFRPAFLMIKRSSSTGDWFIYNNKTSLANVVAPYLVANTTGAEGTYTTLDFVSNGFKLRVSDAEVNGNGSTIIFMAFAENPFKTSLAR